MVFAESRLKMLLYRANFLGRAPANRHHFLFHDRQRRFEYFGLKTTAGVFTQWAARCRVRNHNAMWVLAMMRRSSNSSSCTGANANDVQTMSPPPTSKPIHPKITIARLCACSWPNAPDSNAFMNWRCLSVPRPIRSFIDFHPNGCQKQRRLKILLLHSI